MDWLSKLILMDACSLAREWAARQPDPRSAWEACERSDWMLWLISRLRRDAISAVSAGMAMAAVESLPDTSAEVREQLGSIVVDIGGGVRPDVIFGRVRTVSGLARSRGENAEEYACQAVYCLAMLVSDSDWCWAVRSHAVSSLLHSGGSREDAESKVAAAIRPIVPFESIEEAAGLTVAGP